jgi:hypothetical protein
VSTANHTPHPTPHPDAQPPLPSRSHARKRVRHRPADQLLTSRDIETLRWLAEQYAARTDHIQTLLGCGGRQSQRVLARLRAHDLVTSRRLLANEVPWVTPTPKGMRLSATHFRVWPPNITLLKHLASVNDVRLHIEARSPAADWTSERVLARENDSRSHLPDAVVLLDGQSIAIEVELSLKSERRLKAILNNLSSEHDAILYFTSPAPRKRLIELAASGKWPKLGVREIPTIVGEAS